MATVTFVRHTIACDGCSAIFAAPIAAASLTEVRSVAYMAGWRFPPQVTKSRRVAARTSDACPSCIGTWEPQAGGSSPPRVLTVNEAMSLIHHLFDLTPQQAV